MQRVLRKFNYFKLINFIILIFCSYSYVSTYKLKYNISDLIIVTFQLDLILK